MAFSSPNNPKALPPAKGVSGTDLVDENIDEVILRLLGLEDVFDIDYDTYISLLRERVAAARMSGTTLSTEEAEMVTNEFKRVKGKKGQGRFKVKKISAESFKKGSATGINLGKKSISGIASPRALLPPADEAKNPLQEIIGALAEIIKILNAQKKFQKDLLDRQRKDRENLERGLSESKLENGFKKATKVAEKILSPVKSLLQRILDFFLTLLVGRVVYKLIEWFGDKENQKKVQSIIRFLGDHWPKLLALYLRFGTGIGRFVGTLSKLLISGAIKLGALAAKLIGAKGVSKFLGGKQGKLLGAGLQIATTVGTTMALSSGIENFGGISGAGQEKPEKVEGYSGGGRVRLPAFSGGGGFNFDKMFGQSMGSGNEVSGFVSGEKGVDKVPAMLSDGEFVMSAGAVRKYGVDTLESMNAAGGGTNRPRMISGTTYARGGGMIGNKDTEAQFEPLEDKSSRGPGSTPKLSTQQDFDKFKQLAEAEKFQERLKRIEAQMQVQKALASGKGLDIKGATLGADLGKGFATTFQGRDAIVIKGGGKNYSTGIGDKEITVGGQRYFAMKRGNDVLYVSRLMKGLKGQVDKYGARNKSYAGTGGGIMSGLSDKDKKNLPKTKIMMGPDGPYVGYLTFKNGEPSYQRPTQRKKGMLESLADFFDPKGAKGRQETLNARTMRLTGISDLEDMRRRGMKEDNIKEMMNERLGPNGYSRAVNDLKAKEDRMKRENDMKKLSGSSSISSGNTNIGVSGLKSKELKLSNSNRPKVNTPTPPSKPPVVVKPTSSKPKNQGGQRSAAKSQSKLPNFGATCKAKDRPRNAKILGIF